VVDTILNGLLPVAFVIMLGWLSARIRLLKHDDAGVLATLVIRFALPFALFEGAVKTSPEKLHNVGFALCLTLGLMGTYLIALAVGRFVFKHDLRTATMQALVCAFPDMAYFGAPILAAVFGPEGFLAVLVGNLITSIFMLPLTIVLTNLGGTGENEGQRPDILRIFGQSIARAVINPIVWLPISGMVLSFAHVTLPGPVLTSIDLIAKAAGGTSLFALGLMQELSAAVDHGARRGAVRRGRGARAPGRDHRRRADCYRGRHVRAQEQYVYGRRHFDDPDQYDPGCPYRRTADRLLLLSDTAAPAHRRGQQQTA
jgi:malonate transporter